MMLEATYMGKQFESRYILGDKWHYADEIDGKWFLK